MLRLLKIFLLKNSSPFFSLLVRVRASKLDTLLIGIIKPYNFYYWYFLLRLLVREIFAGPFQQAKIVSSSITVVIFDNFFSNCSHTKTNRAKDMKPSANGFKYPKFL